MLINDIEVPVCYAHFNNEKFKAISDKSIAEVHNMKVKHVRKNIKNNIHMFNEGVDYIDLKKHNLEKELINLGYTKAQRGNSKNIYLLSKSGYAKLSSIMNDRYLSKQILSIYFEDSEYIEPSTRKELMFLDLLEEGLELYDIKGIRQYPILNYRIDYYIPELNIAIEYDENDHKDYTYEEHEGRQLKIEEVLGCRFIRVSDNKTNNYNVCYVIKTIMG